MSAWMPIVHFLNCPHKWISVKQNLPDDGQRIFIYNGKIHIACYNSCPGPGITPLWESRYASDGWVLDNVTHWMSLPDQPV